MVHHFYYELKLTPASFSVLSRLYQVSFEAPVCEGMRRELVFLIGDYSSSAEFFVTIAVFAFLYSLMATIVYIFFKNKYHENNRAPLIVSIQSPLTRDLFTTWLLKELFPVFSSLVLAIRTLWWQWCSPSCGWSVHLLGQRLCLMWNWPLIQMRCSSSSLPAKTRPTGVAQCTDRAGLGSTPQWYVYRMSECASQTLGVNESLHHLPVFHIALPCSDSLQVFGFLNFVLWAGNIWFVFKETGWHKGAPRLAGGASEKQAGTFNQEPYNQGSFDQTGSHNIQGDLGQPSEYSQVGGPTSYSNQM